MGKKLSNKSNKFKVNKRLALKALPVAAVILIAAGVTALLFHSGNGISSQYKNINVDNLSVKAEPKPADTAASSEVSAPAPSTSQTTTTTLAPTLQDTCDEQAAADALAKAKAGVEYEVNLYNQAVAGDTQYHSQGGTTDSQYRQYLDFDRFTEDKDINDIDQNLGKQLTQLGCPIVHPF